MRIHVVFSIALAAGCSGGGGGDDDPPDAGGISASCMEATTHSDLAWIQDNVFSHSCAGFTACHRGTAHDADGLNLEAGSSHAQLVNQQSEEAPSMMRVMPGSAQASYLLVALGQISGTLPKDGTMPLNSPLLCNEKRDAIERWIMAGAPE